MTHTPARPAEPLPAVLVVHNAYQRRGGEDVVVQAEVDLLRSRGARVETMVYDSRDTPRLQAVTRRPAQLVFNRAAYAEAREWIRRARVEVVHCHNLFPLLSTSIYDAAEAEGVPVVQTIHNYRMACLNGTYHRDGQVCERCRPGRHALGVVYGCYRGSRVQSLAFGAVQTVNSWRGAWQQPAVYVVPTAFVRQKLIGWNLPAEKIVVKPHFVASDPGERAEPGRHALFVGRLSEEKGLDLLLDAWRGRRLPLVIVGDGPLRERLERRARDEGLSNVRFAGYQERDGVSAFLRRARYLVMPSTWFESFGLVLIEAYAHGVPVVATRIGAIENVVRDGVTGLLFRLNDGAELGARLDELERNPERLQALGRGARSEYERRYSAAIIADQLRAIYARALRHARC